MPSAEVVFIAVGTPSRDDGSVEMKYVEAVASEIGEHLDHYIVVNKSTVLIGTGDGIIKLIQHHYTGEFDVVSNPEFLREGQAVNDFVSTPTGLWSATSVRGLNR